MVTYYQTISLVNKKITEFNPTTICMKYKFLEMVIQFTMNIMKKDLLVDTGIIIQMGIEESIKIQKQIKQTLNNKFL